MKLKANAILTTLFLSLVLLLILWGLRPLPVQAGTLTVCASGCDHSTVQAAVSAAVSGDVISIQAGTYTETVLIDNIVGTLTIQGAGANSTIVDGAGIDQQSVFELTDSVVVTMSGLTVQGGETSLLTSNTFGLGGGIHVDVDAQLYLDGVVVKDNRAEFAGGGIVSLGQINIRDSEIRGNEVTGSEGEGGGLYAVGPMTLTTVLVSDNSADVGGGIVAFDRTLITDSTIIQNTAVDGGGIYVDSGDIQIEQTTVQTNTATEQGGGLYVVDGNVILSDSIISDNQGHGGGGIYYQMQDAPSKSMQVTRLTLTGNSATGVLSSDGGGGIYNNHVITLTQSLVADNITSQNDVFGGGLFNAPNGRFYVQNSTISGNQSTRGGGIFNTGQMTLTNVTIYRNLGIDPGVSVYMTPTLAIPPAVTVTPTLTAMNTAVVDAVGASNCSGATAWNSLGYNVVSDASCGLTGSADRQNVSAFLQPLADNGGPTQTSAPAINSPLINTGNPDGATCPAKDQRGVARPVGERCDVGAYETTVFRIYLPAILR